MGGSPTTPHGPLTGVRIDQYEVCELIGAGGMGHVYRARDHNLARDVALKTLKEPLPDAQQRRRFLDEIRFSCRIEHPYVAQVYDAIEYEETVLLVMQLVRGKTLAQVIREGGAGNGEAVRMATEVAEALEAIHAGGVVHRDLKPANVMLAEDGHVRVMDFGLATRALGFDATTSETVSLDGRVVGTLAYMSPEQLKGRRADRRSDLFALGVIVAELVTGRHPFERDSLGETVLAIVSDTPFAMRPPVESSPALPLAISLMAKEPDERPDSAAAVVAALRAIGTGDGIHLPIRASRRPLRIAGAAVLVLALAVGTRLAVREWTTFEQTASARAPIVAVVAGRTGDDAASATVTRLVATFLGERPDVVALDGDDLPALPEGAGTDDALAFLAERTRATHIARVDVYRDEGDERLCTVELRAADPDAANTVFSLRGGSLASLSRQAADRLGVALGVAPDASVGLIDSQSEDALRLFQRAEQLAADYRWKDALDLASRALDADRGFVRAIWKRAVWLEQAGDTVQARETIDEAVEKLADLGIEESSAVWLEIAGSRAVLYGETDTAVDIYRRLAEARPEDTGLAVTYARLLRRSGDTRLALSVVDRAGKTDPYSHEVPLERSRILAETGSPDDAIAEAERGLAIAEQMAIPGGRGGALETLGFAYFKAGRFEDSRDAYRRAIDSYRRNDMGLLELRPLKSWADMELNLWNLAEAEALLDRAQPLIEESGNLGLHVRTLNSLASAYYRQRKLGEAIRVLDRSMQIAELVNDDALIWTVLVQATIVHALRRDIESAREAAERAARIGRVLNEPARDVFLALRRAEIDHIAGDFGAAVRRAREVLDIEPGDARALSAELRLLAVHSDSGELSQAVAAGDRAVAIAERLRQDERLGFALALRSRSLALAGRLVEAGRDLDRADGLLADTSAPILADALGLARAQLLAGRGEWQALLDSIEVHLDRPTLQMALTAVLYAEALDRSGAPADAPFGRRALERVEWLPDWVRVRAAGSRG